MPQSRLHVPLIQKEVGLMRDDRHKWPTALGVERPDLVQNQITLRVVPVRRQTVVSGDIADCLAKSGCKAAVGGGLDIAWGETYCLRQRRDRILVVNGPDLDDGWHSDQNVAVSDMTAAYAIIEIVGAKAEQLIATGTEFIANRPSASTSMLWHGFGVLLYRHGGEHQFRMHVRSPLLDPVWEMLERQIGILSNLWREEETTWLSKEGDGTKVSCREAS